MRVKLSLPTAFCAVVKVQWALPVTCRSPLGRGQGRAQGGGTDGTPRLVKLPWLGRPGGHQWLMGFGPLM